MDTVRREPKVSMFVALTVIQCGAAAFAAALSNGGKDSVYLIVSLVLVATLAAPIREIIKELTSTDRKAARDVKRSMHLLNFLADRFPSLMNTLTSAVTSSPERYAETSNALQASVLREISQIVPRPDIRVAHFRLMGERFVAAADCPGWLSSPACPEDGLQHVIRNVLNKSSKVWSEDLSQEFSVYTASFRITPSCQSLVAVPIRSTTGLTGYIYVECDEKNSLDERVANIIVALTQVLSASISVSSLRMAQAANVSATPTKSEGGAKS